MSRKLFLALLFLMTSILTVSAQNYLIYGVGFYNLEIFLILSTTRVRTTMNICPMGATSGHR